MRPLEALDATTARRLVGLLFDLDDTVLSHGTLTREAYGALWDLHDAGLKLVMVTGRPSGWGEVLARQWPVDAAITENGAIWILREARGVSVLDRCDAAERRSRRARLAGIVERMREVVPEARTTDDVDMRRSDVTWDVGERVKMPEDRARAMERVIHEAGARSSRSSVHLHATFAGDDKASGAIALLCERFGEDASAARARWAFAGDSGNDRACFDAFDVTFGVANVAASMPRLALPPRWVARGEMGTGFVEIAARVLALRGDAAR